jgi:putative phage-type endonuclease
MFKIVEVEQNTEEWMAERRGLITGSEFSKVTTGKTLKRSTSHVALVNAKVAERLSGKTEEGYYNQAMQNGHDREDDALNLVNFAHGYNFEKVGFIKSTELDIGCSLDAIDQENKMILEIKSPLASTHIGYLRDRKVPATYHAQVQGNLMVTGYSKAVFMSYHPDLPPLVIEVERDEVYISALRKDLEYCCEQINKICQELKPYMIED